MYRGAYREQTQSATTSAGFDSESKFIHGWMNGTAEQNCNKLALEFCRSWKQQGVDEGRLALFLLCCLK